MRRGRRRMLRAVAHAVVLVSGLAAGVGTSADAGPLAGIVLDDDAGRSWRFDELEGRPVLLVVADRSGAGQANAWGARLAGPIAPLAPWRAAGKVAWLAVADLRRVPDYARDAARDRVREREAGRSAGERGQSSPLLLDWNGLIAGRFRAERGEALLVLLASDGRVLVQARGAPTDAGVARLREALGDAATP